MKNLSLLTGTFAILSTLVVATPGLTQTAAAPRLPSTQPNLTFDVQRQSGACPRTVSLWHSTRYYEGGGEHTAIANTAAIARAARLVGSNKKYAEFRAPLQRAYASCVGQARSNEDYPLHESCSKLLNHTLFTCKITGTTVDCFELRLLPVSFWRSRLRPVHRLTSSN
ncbi:hypothetical protein [Microseira wollei]|uniref:Uncharacterized protein n=1 Tax=Microseira wollei NIES-4236 TaxID=2530354 RepID=A0AAV3XTF3_9CYAN|nr:hypothetical protein [Microseira wollei]GET43960.1 hypothetical protein MiSe_87860 [Microseira wollei NIES-4236]